jgi:ABC-type multidrug transport system fused ATPase/permease subunit
VNSLQYLIFFQTFLVFLVGSSIREESPTESLLNANENERESQASYQTQNFYMKLSMLWVYPILKLGTIRSIDFKDIEKIGKSDQCHVQNQKLQNFMPQVYETMKKNALLMAIFKCYRREILIITFLGVILMIFDFTVPIFIELLENFLASSQPTWRGIALVFYLLLSKLTQTILRSFHTFVFNLLHYNIQTAVTSEIYQKLMRVSTSVMSSESLSFGTVLNLANVDSGQITTGITDGMKLAVLPFTFTLGFYLMFHTIGSSSGLTGSVIVFILLALNTFIGRQSTKAQKSLMSAKDSRIKTCNEMLANIRMLKIFAWEGKLSEKVLQEREVEVKAQEKILLWFIFSIFLNWGTQDYMSAGVISTMALSGTVLTPGKVYAGLAVMKVLNSSIFVLPPIINCLVQTRVSVDRIQGFLRAKDQKSFVRSTLHQNHSIFIRNASFSWNLTPDGKENELKEFKVALRNINLVVGKGELVAIVGKVAAGKSALLQAIAQNMEIVEGDDSLVEVNGSLAFCNQEPWIQNKTIKENILFGKNLDTNLYQEVLRVTMLSNDLASLPGGDMTEIGEKGINLSGGQKARVCIARAVYSNSDILLLDDPLAALDQYVGRAVFEECIKKHLKNKTRLLVTNNQQYLGLCDRILVIRKGMLVQNGRFDELISIPGHFRDKFMVSIQQKEMSQKSLNEELTQSLSKEISPEIKLNDSEDRVIGKVDVSVYKQYFRHYGHKSLASVFALLLIWQGLRMFTDFYLAYWTSESKSTQDSNLIQNVAIFITGSLFVNFAVLITNLTSFSSGLKASRSLFISLIQSLSNASISLFYDTNPMGRVLNRLSRDMNELDSSLVYRVFWALTQIFAVLMSITFCLFTVPIIIFCIPLTAFLGMKVQKFYLSTSREVIRLASISKSPISQHFSESLSGLSTIRAFNTQKRFTSEYCEFVDQSTVLGIYETGCSGWISITLEGIFDLVLAGSALAIVLTRGEIDPGLAGACLIYAMSLPASVSYMIISMASLENSMVSVERVLTMAETPSEGFRVQKNDKRLENWPSHGKVIFQNFSARYRPGLQNVLNSVNFELKPAEKIGIMGRTGSGKSTIVKAILRIVQRVGGNIFIDGVDVESVGLDLLRQKICVIVQEPALFHGSLRENIDLLGVFNDLDILKALEIVGFSQNGFGIDSIIGENANNLSLGQKQLLCIARALLKRSKLAILDEATASIDFQTDLLVQKVVMESMKESTVIIIAHRVASVENCDKVMVLDHGEIAEFGTVKMLRECNGAFCRLVQGER